MLWLVQRVFFGPVKFEGHDQIHDLSWREIAALAPLAVLVFWIGVYPQFFLAPVSEPLNALIQPARTRLVGAAQPQQVAQPAQSESSGAEVKSVVAVVGAPGGGLDP